MRRSLTKAMLSVLINPTAGRGRAGRLIPRLSDELERSGLEHEIIVTRDVLELRHLAREKGLQSHRLLVVGGDSTFAVVTQEILSSKKKPVLAFLPAGTCNDLAREFSLISPAAVLNALKTGFFEEIDGGRINLPDGSVHYFAGQASIGFGALFNLNLAARQASRPLLSRIKPLARFLAGWKTLDHPHLPIELQLETDRDQIKMPCITGLFSNIKYYACGLRTLPSASPRDGILDGLLIGKVSKSTFIRLLLLAASGKEMPASITKTISSSSFRISAEKPFLIQADGDLLPDPKHPLEYSSMEISCLPGALRVVTKQSS